MSRGSWSLEMKGLFEEGSSATLYESGRFAGLAWRAKQSRFSKNKSLWFLRGSRGMAWGSTRFALATVTPSDEEISLLCFNEVLFFLVVLENEKPGSLPLNQSSFFFSFFGGRWRDYSRIARLGLCEGIDAIFTLQYDLTFYRSSGSHGEPLKNFKRRDIVFLEKVVKKHAW